MSVAIKPPHVPPDIPARKLVNLPQPLRLYRGGLIAKPVVAYESWGRRSLSRPGRDTSAHSQRLR